MRPPTNLGPQCNGICVMAGDILEGMPFDHVAYAHPDCPLHSPPAPVPVNIDLGKATAKAKPCDDCGGSGFHSSIDGRDLGTCPTCQGHGIEALLLRIPAPTIKPVRKRKTGKMFTRNPMLNANDRDHWRVMSPIRKEWRRLGRGYGNALRLRNLDLQHAQIDYYVHRPINSRSDAGNFYPTVKAIIDGLIDAHLLPDDNDDHLTGPYPHKGTKGPYAITIVITPTPGATK